MLVSEVRNTADVVHVLLLGVQRVARHLAIVKNLSSVETLGYAPQGQIEHAGAALAAGPQREEAIVVLSGGSLAGNADLRQTEGGGWEIHGDHPKTAARIAADLGIVEAGSAALTGAEIDALDETAFAEAVRTTSAYARVAAAHKLRTVDALQADGNVVAMTGDGVNDALALKAADICIAMGVDLPSDDLMARKPWHVHDRLIDARMYASVGQTGVVIAVVTLLTMDFYLPHGLISGTGDLNTARTAGFTVLVFTSLFTCLTARSDTTSAFTHLFTNAWLRSAIALSLLGTCPGGKARQ